jgi:hypothetical protein
MAKIIVLCIALAATTLFARVPHGFTVTANTATQLRVTYISDATQLLGPSLREHRSADGALRQIIASADVIVSGEHGFEVVGHTSNIGQTQLQLPAMLQQDVREQRYPDVLAQRAVLRYVGVSGDRHVARLSLVIAEQNGETFWSSAEGAHDADDAFRA